MPAAAGAGAGAGKDAPRKQRERFVQAGGVVQGYPPDRVIRFGIFAAGGGVLCLVIMALLLLFLPYGWPVRIVAAIVWIVPIVFGASVIAPGIQLALKDRRATPRMVQGDLMGASEFSTALGLGMLMLRTRGGNEQYLVDPAKLARVPGNQVKVMINVTPFLRHVVSLQVMGQRMLPRPDQPIPPVLKRLRLLPILTPAVLSTSAIVGTDVVAFVPIQPDPVHAAAALGVGALLSAGTYGATFLAQRRMYDAAQKLVPGGFA
jgi:hypothetical protein